jgi:hypothetical protein
MSDQQSIDRQLTSLEERLNKQIRRSRNTQNMTLVVGVILILIIAGYFAWAGYWTRQIVQPKELAGIAGMQVVSFIKEKRPIVEREAQANAGPLVNRLVDEVLQNQLPSGRKFLEDFAKEESNRALDKMTEFLLVSLEASLEANKAQISELSRTLETSEGREAYKASLLSTLKEAIADEEITRQLDEYAFALKDLEGTLTRITTGGENLTTSEKATYDLIATILELARRNISGVDFLEAPSFEGIEKVISEELPSD